MRHDHQAGAGQGEGPIPAVVFLSGSRRGETLRLSGGSVRIGTDPDSEILIPADTEPLPLPHHATLERRGQSYEIISAPGARIWVNGELLERLVLASGDVLEIGRDGAILRFRLYDSAKVPYKSLPEVFSDCAECVRAERGALRKTGALVRVLPRELATRTTRRFRALTVMAFVTIAGTTTLTARRSRLIEAQLLDQIERVEDMSSLATQASAVSTEELDEVVAALRTTGERVEALEARNSATSRVIESAAEATLFIQGSYGFTQSESGRPLRTIAGPDGSPLRNARGHPALTVDGDGPVFEIFLTGTGFVTSPDGLALTNRHVVLPWEFDAAARGLLESGFVAEWSRLVGFLSDGSEARNLELRVTADDSDLAVVQVLGVEGRVPFIELASEPPSLGDPVIVMGYPLGLRALMARSDADFIDRLRREGVADFFEQAHEIAAAGFMQPLATLGIVGQVTSANVVYDAETTSGGSGGPVLSLDGLVVAVNTAILPEFGGSNLGVPVARARALIEGLRGG
jgi:S1-C subfamily serine protease